MREMEVQRSQDNLKTVREVELRIKQTEIRMCNINQKVLSMYIR